MEAAAAGEAEDVFGNGAAGFDDFLFGFFESRGIEDDEDAAAGWCARSETAINGVAFESDVFGTVIGEFPGEAVRVECFDLLEILREKFNVLDLLVFEFHRRRGLRRDYFPASVVLAMAILFNWLTNREVESAF